MKKYLINLVLVLLIFGIVIWLEYKEYEDKNFEKQVSINKNENNIIQENNNEIVLQENFKVEHIVQEEKQYPKVKIAEEYNGYIVDSKLEIPKINLETYVLKNYSEVALNVSVTKFWGANPNEVGNFCIAGHNFKRKNMFHNLKDLKIGDKLYIEDNKIGKVEYEIYDLYKVVPEDVSCLSQETYGRREVTLITCTNDSQKRIIVKAKERKI